MGKFKKEGKFSRGGNFGGGRDFGKRGGGRSESFRAVCDACGQSCEVPFKPTGDKPIYCSDCFQGKRGDSPRRERSGFGNDRSSRQMHSAICDACGQKCEVPFRPTGDKPIYCDSCFEKNKGGSGSMRGASGDGKMKDQLDALNAKMDKILQILEGGSNKKVESKIEDPEVVLDLTPKKKAEPKKTLKKSAKVEKATTKKTPVKKSAAKKKN